MSKFPTIPTESSLDLYRQKHNELVEYVGDLDGLSTDNQDSLVDGINEIKNLFLDFVASSYGPIPNDTYIMGDDVSDNATLELFKVTSSNTLVFNQNILPASNNTKTLGSESLNWSNVYSVGGTFSVLLASSYISTPTILVSSIDGGTGINQAGITLIDVEDVSSQGKFYAESGNHANATFGLNTKLATTDISIFSAGVEKVRFGGTQKNYRFFQDHEIKSDVNTTKLLITAGTGSSDSASIELFGNAAVVSGVSAKIRSASAEIRLMDDGDLEPEQESDLGSTTKKFGQIHAKEIHDDNLIGEVKMWPAVALPVGFHLCDGQSLAVATYPVLFGKIGYTFGGSGANFNVPNYIAHSPIGLDASKSEINALTDKTGTWNHTHTLPAHKHDKGSLAIASSGTHTTTATSNTVSDHTHTINHDHGNLSISGGGHGHAHTLVVSTEDFAVKTMSDTNPSNPLGSGGIALVRNAVALGDTNRGDHTHTLSGSIGGADGTHAHNVDLPNFTGTSGSGGTHSHTITVTGTGAHTHANGDFSGQVGNVAGVSGDSTMTSGSGNGPLFAIYFIIRSS